jgi:threonine dehydratase
MAGVREAAAGLLGVAERTPLVESAALSRLAGVPVFLKCEHLQPIGAFKIRGAYTAIRRLSLERRRHGVVTHSSGNHGLAVAWAAERLGVRAVVVMPADAPRIKLEGVRRHGAELVLVPDRGLRESTMARLVEEQGLVPIPPYDHSDVVDGQATCGLEILEQLPGVATILAPVSGGGLLGGIATAVAGLKADVRIIGVEPEGAPKLSAALAHGGPSRVDRPASLADGLLAPAIGRIPWEALAPVVREAIAVSDLDLIAAVRFLYQVQGLRVEPSGAAPVAALLAGRTRLAETAGGSSRPCALVLSGGNVDPELFLRLVQT